MRTDVRLCFDVADIPEGGWAFLALAGLGSDIARLEDVPVLGVVDAWVTLEETDARLPLLLDLLRRRGMSWLEWHNDVFTEEELDTAPLLLMQPAHVAEVSGGVRWGMTYDLSGACPACGTGGRQTSAVFIAGEELGDLEGRRAGATIFAHMLVDESLAAELERIDAKGLSFRSVYALMPDKRQVKLRWRQLCADKTLPAMSPRTTGLVRDRACGVCRRNGYFGTMEQPTRIVYRAADLRDADDVNLTWENQGYAILNADIHESLLSNPWMLVTPKVRRVFRDAGVTEIDWLPVRTEETDG